MKLLGHTVEHDYLVSMSQYEYDAFADLARVERGWTELESVTRGQDALAATYEVDVSMPLVAIRLFTQFKSRLNEMQDLLEIVSDSLNRQEGVVNDRQS